VPFDGSKTYKVDLPKDIPAARFWSFTVYDNQSRSMLQTPQKYPRAGSQGYPTPAAACIACLRAPSFMAIPPQTNSISQRLSEINSRLYSTPGNTRALRDITRKQETKEALYLYLLQKREESQIAFKQAEPNLKIIDRAFSEKNYPEGTDSMTLYLGALLIGLFLPFAIIYVRELLDTKIHNKIDLEKIIDGAPIIGELPRLSKKESKLVMEDDRSILAEAMRILRTNLYYVLNSAKGKQTGGKVIMVTSSIANEGKTFLSTNLAYLLAKANHKVLLIGADIRNPKIRSFISENQKFRSSDSTDKKFKGLIGWNDCLK